MSDSNDLHPAALPVEQQMDLLVDDELPETQRRTLLTSLDQQPARWRQLAVLFLERQTERSVARGAIEGRLETAGAAHGLDDAERIAPFHGNWKITPLKAAGLLILGALTLALTVPWGSGGAGGAQPGAAAMSTLNVSLPARLTGGATAADARVPIAPGAARPIRSVLQLPSAPPGGMQRHLIFMRDPAGRLMVVVVTPENLQ